jgi:hypothetical protein
MIVPQGSVGLWEQNVVEYSEKNLCSVLCVIMRHRINTVRRVRVANATVAQAANKRLPIPLTRFTTGGK